MLYFLVVAKCFVDIDNAEGSLTLCMHAPEGCSSYFICLSVADLEGGGF